jgi:hypothetical protein
MATLGDYEVLRALKSGGMGEVLLARRRGPAGFERLVAIKTIRPELAAAAAVRVMFLDEAKLLARLGHPAIAQVSDFGEEDGGLYLVMEYVQGIRFRELADRPPPPGIAARAVADAARGVHAAHELRDLDGHPMGVVHRDLSPDNLMLGWDGQVKVLDFGIALVKGRQAPVTEVGTIKGKPPYMSPEQVKNEAIDRRSDVWSLGLVLHELLTGKTVFDGDSIYAVARSVVSDPIAPPSQVAGQVMPAGLDAAVMGALDRDLARRTASAAELADALDRVSAAEGGETLASWAARELADEREAHRRWLAEVVSRATGVRAAIGRPTGMITALAIPSGDQAPPPVEVGPTRLERPGPDERDPESPIRLDREVRGAKGRFLLFILLLLVPAIGIVYVATRRPGPPPPEASFAVGASGSALDAATLPAALDAPRVQDVPLVSLDARPLERVDARPRSTAPRPPVIDAQTAPMAPPTPPRSDAARAAAQPPPPVGAGTVSFTADPFAMIRVDGNDMSSTPRFNVKLGAGRHHIQLISPDSGAIRYDRTVELRDGDHVDVHP